MKMVNCDFNSAEEAIYAQGDLGIIGDFISAYLNMAMAVFEVLQMLERQSIMYKVSPLFPYEIPEFREMDEGALNEILKLSNEWEELYSRD